MYFDVQVTAHDPDVDTDAEIRDIIAGLQYGLMMKELVMEHGKKKTMKWVVAFTDKIKQGHWGFTLMPEEDSA